MSECVRCVFVCASSYLSVLELEPARQTWLRLQTDNVGTVVLKSWVPLGCFSHIFVQLKITILSSDVSLIMEDFPLQGPWFHVLQWKPSLSYSSIALNYTNAIQIK